MGDLLLAAVDGGMPKSAVARTFRVGRATVKRYLARRRASGSVAPARHPGSTPRIPVAAEPALLAQLAAAPDATLAEHCAAWERSQHVRVSLTTMHRAMARICWTRKKRR